MEWEWSSQKLSAEYLCVNSCGTEIALERDIPTHRPQGRVDYHILYIEKGACALEQNGQRREVAQGNVILLRPGEAQHYCLLARYRSVSQYIHFAGTGCEVLLGRFLPRGQSVFFVGTSGTCGMVLERMAQERIFKRDFYEETCAAYLYQLLALLGRKAGTGEESAAALSDRRIGQICCQMQREYNKDVPLEQYAASCCLSMSRFAHLFTQCVGVPPGAYRNRLRIERAKELLLFTDLPVGEVGALVGFEDSSYFTRLFTAAVGRAPTRYRQGR